MLEVVSDPQTLFTHIITGKNSLRKTGGFLKYFFVTNKNIN